MERETTNSLYTVEECEVWEGVDESEKNANSSNFQTNSRSPLKRLEVEAMPRSSGNKNFVTPAIKHWYILCGVCYILLISIAMISHSVSLCHLL